MSRYVLSLFLLLMLAGCGQKNPGQMDLVEPDSEATMSPGSTSLIGKQTYDKYCAVCHEEGLDGAPRTGDRDAWDERSWLWEAVLFEHARSGYGNMPAKGGDATLDDATVTKAAEYLMTLTYPELPRADGDLP